VKVALVIEDFGDEMGGSMVPGGGQGLMKEGLGTVPFESEHEGGAQAGLDERCEGGEWGLERLAERGFQEGHGPGVLAEELASLCQGQGGTKCGCWIAVGLVGGGGVFPSGGGFSEGTPVKGASCLLIRSGIGLSVCAQGEGEAGQETQAGTPERSVTH
jgi:hypothetical protein